MSHHPGLPTPDARLVETEPGGNLPAPPPGNARYSLPEDLLREASRRLGTICLISAFVWSANLLLLNFVYAVPGNLSTERAASYLKWESLYDLVVIANVGVSLGLFWFTRRRRVDPQLVLNIALVYEVFTAFSVGFLDYADQGPTEGVSWIAVIILLFAPIIPASPRKTLVTALLAATMAPVGALIWGLLGVDPVGARQILLLSIPNYLCAAMAPVVSHLITRLGREVRQAREMGSYVLGALIARGGMGEVWQATHRFLVRPAAIKLIKSETIGAGDPAQTSVVVQRFRREARAAGALRSPHTIQLYDFGVAADGTFYYVMELLNGMDLQNLVSQYGPLPPGRTIHILKQICESLGEAHTRGLIHRDIKPANIQICRMGRECDFVKVLDFGLVKRAGPAESTEPGLTSPNMLAGTPAYLSPEVASGEPIDHRSDIYSLGCVAYWMLTGRQVFQADGLMQMIARHIQAVPEPPSRHSPFPVPAELDEIVLDCLAKFAPQRPASAWELADRLARCEADSPWTRDDAQQWWEKRLEPETAVTL